MYSYKSSSVTIGYESFRTRFFYIVVWHQASVYTKLVINIKVLSLISVMKILFIHVYNDVCVILAYIWKWEIRSLNMKNVFTYHILVASTIFRYCIPILVLIIVPVPVNSYNCWISVYGKALQIFEMCIWKYQHFGDFHWMIMPLHHCQQESFNFVIVITTRTYARRSILTSKLIDLIGWCDKRPIP